jgi:hypothetical protein
MKMIINNTCFSTDPQHADILNRHMVDLGEFGVQEEILFRGKINGRYFILLLTQKNSQGVWNYRSIHAFSSVRDHHVMGGLCRHVDIYTSLAGTIFAPAEKLLIPDLDYDPAIWKPERIVAFLIVPEEGQTYEYLSTIGRWEIIDEIFGLKNIVSGKCSAIRMV